MNLLNEPLELFLGDAVVSLDHRTDLEDQHRECNSDADTVQRLVADLLSETP